MKYPLPSNNEWQNFEYIKSEHIIQYGQNKGKVKRANVRHTNVPDGIVGIGYELMHVPTKKTKKIKSLSIDFSEHASDRLLSVDFDFDFDKMPISVVWAISPYGTDDVYYPIEEVMFRYDVKHIARIQKIVDTIQIGDFVKCSGTRLGDWNKIEAFQGNNIYGPKYREPKEGSMRYTSSTNHITKIIKIVRNGEKLL